MRGQFAVTEEMVNQNKMGWNVFDFFKNYLKGLGIGIGSGAGWYARKLEHGVHYFLWADRDEKISIEYLQSLKKDGWQTLGNYG